jgi:hypothetical protein
VNAGRRYPNWDVDHSYTLYDYREARLLAAQIATRDGRPVDLMQTDDAMSPAFVLEQVHPTVRRGS